MNSNFTLRKGRFHTILVRTIPIIIFVTFYLHSRTLNDLIDVEFLEYWIYN